MSDKASQHPTEEQVREARHAGFRDSFAHSPVERQERMRTAYEPQDARRAQNVSDFYNRMAGEDR